jgi:phage gp36-like protein
MSAPVYATTADLAKYVPAGALASVSAAVQEQALLDASAEAFNYIPDQATVPLVAPYDPALVRHVCWLAAWQIMSFRGLNVEAGSNDLFKINRDAALAWLTKVARREITLASDGGPLPSRSPRVASATPRNWDGLPIR